MTMRPASSTPAVTGDIWTPPEERRVTSTMWCRGRTNDSSSSSDTRVLVATLRGIRTSALRELRHVVPLLPRLDPPRVVRLGDVERGDPEERPQRRLLRVDHLQQSSS